MEKRRNYREIMEQLKRMTAELEAMIADGSFYRLSFAHRSAWIARVKRECGRLRGPVGRIDLKPFLAAAAAAALSDGCPAPGGNGVLTPAFGASSANPFGLANVGRNASPCFADIDNDGDLDAFIGNNAGNTIFFRNTAL